MSRSNLWAVLALLLATSLAGCTSGDDTPDGEEDMHDEHGDDPVDENGGDETVDETGNETTGGTDNETTSAQERSATLVADNTQAEAGASITFTGVVSVKEADENGTMVEVDPGNFAWVMSLTGEAEDATGDQSSEAIEATYTYEVAGVYDAMFTVTFEDGEEIIATLIITIIEAGEAPPPNYHFESDDAGLIGFGFVLTDQTAAAALASCPASGTWLICHDIPVASGAKNIQVVTTGPDGITPDYELGLFDPSGAFAGGSTNGGSNEAVGPLPNPAAGTWTAVIIVHVGTAVDEGVHTTIDVLYS